MSQPITDIIRELHDEGLHVLPLRHNGEKFIHPEYAGSFDKPFAADELDKFFAKGFNNAYAVIHGKCNPYLKCLDFDEKNAPGKDLYATWQMLIDPDLMSKLVIERTRSNGYHVYFLCNDKVVNKALASSATGAEWIACRSSEMHGLVYAAPSPGYTYLQGSLFDLQEISGQDMAHLCDAACQLNEYTGEKSYTSTSLAPVQMPAAYAPALRTFDRDVEDGFVLGYLQSIGWTIGERVRTSKVKGDDWHYVPVWRPEREKSAPPSGRYWLTNKRLSIFTTSTEFPAWDSGQSFSHSPTRVLYFTMKRDWKAVMSFIGEKVEELQIKLPEITPMAFANPVRGGEVWKVEVKGIIEWAERAGFCWMRMSSSSDTVVELIRVVDNIIYVCDEKELLRAYREEIEHNYNGEQSSRVLHAFMPSVMKYMSALPNFDGELMRDEKDCSYMYFSNGALRISAGNVDLMKYSDLPGCVFARHIKNFEYKTHGGLGDFGEFITNVSMDDAHRRHIMSCLGYILHHYKLRNYAKALMIIEDVEDQEEARGRSGKGLIAQFIEWVRWTVQQDGRNYKSDSQFKMQQIVPGVQVFYLNDPAPNVLMNQFYNFITDDWLVESKGKKSYTIPFKHSPKIMITTNYLPNLESDSDKDRFIVMAIKKHYGSHRSIRDDFPDVIFFSEEWAHNDKLMAVNFAIECIQLYLKSGVVSYQSESMQRNANARLIKNLVPEAIIETMEQGLECARNSKNHFEFEQNLKPYDLRKDTSETLSKAFEWDAKGLIIYVSALYQYVIKAYQMKNMTDKVFGKRVRTYIEKSGYVKENESRNNTKGVRILVQTTKKVDCTDPNLIALNDHLSALDDAPF